MSENAVDVVEAIVNSINRETKVLSIVGLVVTVCSTLWITNGKTVEDGNGNKYKVISFVFDESVTLKVIGGAPTPYEGIIVVAPEPKFYHGTPSALNGEYLVVKSRRELEKLPFIWFLESYNYEEPEGDSSIEMEIDGRLFFMDGSKDEEWTSAEHNALVIKPMENLKDAFVDVIKDDYSFKTLGPVRTRPRSRFGVEVTNKGNERKILDTDLSGLDVRIFMELYDTSICNANC